MLSFNAVRFLNIVEATQKVAEMLRGVSREHPLPSPGPTELIGPIEYIRDNAADLDLTMSVIAANRIVEKINEGCTVGTLISICSET